VKKRCKTKSWKKFEEMMKSAQIHIYSFLKR